MLATARRQTSECGLSVEFTRGSLMALPFGSGSFDAAVCVGVLGHYPLRRGSGNFEEDDVLGLREVVRVLRPGGFMVLTLPNLYRLHWLLDPVQLRRAFQHRRLLLALEAGSADGQGRPPASTFGQEPATRHQTPSEMLRLVRGEGLEILGLDGVGFGPFTILGRPLFSDERSVRISAKLERIAQGSVFSPLNRLAGTWVLTLRPGRAASASPPPPAGVQSSAR
jgi:SAM-dependent methyltransferase